MVILFPKVTTGTQLVDFWRLRFDAVLWSDCRINIPIKEPLSEVSGTEHPKFCVFTANMKVFFCSWELLPEPAAVCVPEIWWRTLSPWTDFSYEVIDFGCSSLS